MTPFKIIVVGDRVRGEGDTVPEAVAATRKTGASPYHRIYVARPDARVDEPGGPCWPQGGQHPVLIDEKLPRGAKAS